MCSLVEKKIVVGSDHGWVPVHARSVELFLANINAKKKNVTIINKQNTEVNKTKYIIESRKLRSRKGNLDGTYPFSYSLAVIPGAVENKIASRID